MVAGYLNPIFKSTEGVKGTPFRSYKTVLEGEERWQFQTQLQTPWPWEPRSYMPHPVRPEVTQLEGFPRTAIAFDFINLWTILEYSTER